MINQNVYKVLFTSVVYVQINIVHVSNKGVSTGRKILGIIALKFIVGV